MHHDIGTRDIAAPLFFVVAVNPTGKTDISATSVFNVLSLVVVLESLAVFETLVELTVLPGVADWLDLTPDLGIEDVKVLLPAKTSDAADEPREIVTRFPLMCVVIVPPGVKSCPSIEYDSPINALIVVPSIVNTGTVGAGTIAKELVIPLTTTKGAEEAKDTCVPWTEIVPPGVSTAPSMVKVRPPVA
jgi:hypothetical protein